LALAKIKVCVSEAVRIPKFKIPWLKPTAID